MATYFTSDTHYCHKNIIKYAGRTQFANIDEMNTAMINRWNLVISPNDDVFHLGDFAFCDSAKAIRIVRQLNGNKHLIFGNHDKKLKKDSAFLAAWNWCRDLATITVTEGTEERRIVLCHYAMRVWDKSHFGAWHLYGHSHGTLPDDPGSMSLDVGVDCWNFTPVSVSQIAQRMAVKTFVPVDRHGRD